MGVRLTSTVLPPEVDCFWTCLNFTSTYFNQLCQHVNASSLNCLVDIFPEVSLHVLIVCQYLAFIFAPLVASAATSRFCGYHDNRATDNMDGECAIFINNLLLWMDWKPKRRTPGLSIVWFRYPIYVSLTI